MRKWNAFKDYILAGLLYVLINVVVFHGGWYGYFCEPDSYAGNVYGRLDVLNEVERENGKRVIALVGDSITEEGMDANHLSNRLDHPVVNLALPGTSPLDWYYFLRSIDPDQDRFERIVLTVVPQNVRTLAHDDGIQTLLPVASPLVMLEYLSTRKRGSRFTENHYAALDRIYAFRRDLSNLILNPSRWTELHSARQKKLDYIRGYEGQDYDICRVRVEHSRVTHWGAIQDPGVRRLIRHNVNRITKLNRTPEIAGILEPLKNIATTYANSSTKIVVVSVPFGPGHRVELESAPISRYMNELSTLMAQGQVLHWTAFEESFYHDCSNFFDFRHLNQKGRSIFSEWLSLKLRGDS